MKSKRNPNRFVLKFDAYASIYIEDNGYGPELCITNNHDGNFIHVFKLLTTPETLKKLGEQLFNIGHQEFSEPYTKAAELQETKEENCVNEKVGGNCCGGGCHE